YLARGGGRPTLASPSVVPLVPHYKSWILIYHVIHHRGQPTVYLRLLDVPVPATYGSSADELWHETTGCPSLPLFPTLHDRHIP
ncbi:MAG: hypothetical protein ACI9K5_004229, partial [Gammaproteobacteria bacterium]